MAWVLFDWTCQRCLCVWILVWIVMMWVFVWFIVRAACVRDCWFAETCWIICVIACSTNVIAFIGIDMIQMAYDQGHLKIWTNWRFARPNLLQIDHMCELTELLAVTTKINPIQILNTGVRGLKFTATIISLTSPWTNSQTKPDSAPAMDHLPENTSNQ